MLKRSLMLVIFTAMLLAWPAQACDNDDADGLDVGLVLSGGGALASTQVGAIQVLDELGVPIHCVAGTSFGAVVGGLYASGYSGHEIAEMFLVTDWNEIILTGQARESKSFLQKEQEAEYFSGYFAGLDENGLRLPSGLASMQELRRFFREKLAHVPIGTGFDDIGIPYRAVATDLSDGTARAFSEGDIVEAILASMAVPGAYAPRKIDGRYYVDGGMAANLPVETAQLMGADIIIAIDTTIAPSEIGGRVDVAAVSQQLLQIVVYRQFESQIELLGSGDVLVQPNLSGLTVAGFDKVETGFASGRHAMEAKRSRLLAIKGLASPSRRKVMPRDTRADEEADIEIENDTLISDDRIARQFNSDPNLEHANRLRDLASFGGFEEVDLAPTLDGVRLAVTERDLGRTLLQTGIRASNSLDGDSKFSLLGRISQQPFNAAGGELDAAFEFGSDYGASLRLTQPFGETGKFFVQPQVYYRGEEILFDIGDLRVGEFWQERFGFRGRVGRELGKWGVIGIDSHIYWGELEAQITLIEDFEPIDYRNVGFGGFFALDTLNRLDWPSSGVKLKASVDRLYEVDSDNATTDRYALSGLVAKEAGPVNIILNGRLQAVDNEDNDPIEVLRLGGFRRLSALPENALPADAYAYGSVEVFRRLTPSDTVFALPIYAGIIGEYAQAEFDFLQVGADEAYSSAGLYLGADTPFGPLFLGGAVGSDSAASAFIYLGRSF